MKRDPESKKILAEAFRAPYVQLLLIDGQTRPPPAKVYVGGPRSVQGTPAWFDAVGTVKKTWPEAVVYDAATWFRDNDTSARYVELFRDIFMAIDAMVVVLDVNGRLTRNGYMEARLARILEFPLWMADATTLWPVSDLYPKRSGDCLIGGKVRIGGFDDGKFWWPHKGPRPSEDAPDSS